MTRVSSSDDGLAARSASPASFLAVPFLAMNSDDTYTPNERQTQRREAPACRTSRNGQASHPCPSVPHPWLTLLLRIWAPPRPNPTPHKTAPRTPAATRV